MSLKKLTALGKKINLKMIRNLVFFVLLIGLTFWFIFKDTDLNELINVIKSAKIEFVIAGVLVMLLYYLMESLNIKSILKCFGEKISILKALKYTWIGFFFSAITPAATGGQPIEIYYMTKDKLSGPNSTLALLLQLCGFQISTIGLGVICAILNPTILDGGLIWLFLLGVIINGFALALMLIGIFSKRLTKKLVNAFIKLLKKCRVKNLDAKKKKMEASLEQYNESAVFIKSHKGEFIKAILRVFIQICLYHSITYFIYRAFGLTELNFFQVFSMQAVLYTTVSGLPLPGAIGVSETVFLKIYGKAFGESLLKGAMLLSRGVTFYLYVIVSLIVVIITAIMKKDVVGQIDKDVIELDKLDNETKEEKAA